MSLPLSPKLSLLISNPLSLRTHARTHTHCHVGTRDEHAVCHCNLSPSISFFLFPLNSSPRVSFGLERVETSAESEMSSQNKMGRRSLSLSISRQKLAHVETTRDGIFVRKKVFRVKLFCGWGKKSQEEVN